jgi:DNA (cytosine-5)-methyltransferase 1
VKFKPTKGQIKRLELSSSDCNKVREKLGLAKSYWLRRLVPVELEKLNGFPLNHTELASDGKRAFFMGNALVIGIVEKLGKMLID